MCLKKNVTQFSDVLAKKITKTGHGHRYHSLVLLHYIYIALLQNFSDESTCNLSYCCTVLLCVLFLVILLQVSAFKIPH